MPGSPSGATPIVGLERPRLAELLAQQGEPAYRADQLFGWIYRRGLFRFEEMTNLAKPLRERLATTFTVTLPTVSQRARSADGTTKFLLTLEDGRQIESVFIPDTPAMTFCLSTQVGCPVRCGFCLTGKMGLVRNLTAAEIVGQVLVLASETGLREKTFNIVLMGMGEPLLNYAATMSAVRVVTDAKGLAVSPRRITLSTVGILPALERLAEEPVMPNLAVSLHATTDELRNTLVPINARYKLADLIAACRRFPVRKRARITFEYVLLEGVNDTAEDAHRLVRLLSGIRAKVNLIPLNEAAGIPFARPADERVNRFAQILADHKLTVSVRKSRGRDIRAACGQLLVEGQIKSPAQRLAAALP